MQSAGGVLQGVGGNAGDPLQATPGALKLIRQQDATRLSCRKRKGGRLKRDEPTRQERGCIHSESEGTWPGVELRRTSGRVVHCKSGRRAKEDICRSNKNLKDKRKWLLELLSLAQCTCWLPGLSRGGCSRCLVQYVAILNLNAEGIEACRMVNVSQSGEQRYQPVFHPAVLFFFCR